jgi:hypothetical protein
MDGGPQQVAQIELRRSVEMTEACKSTVGNQVANRPG